MLSYTTIAVEKNEQTACI